MALDRIKIGNRVRIIRENKYKESREAFADRCSMTVTHIGQIERGEILPSLTALDKIASNCGEDLDYILYGKKENNNIRRNIDIFLDRCNQDELNMYFKCISSIKGYICKFD